MRNPPLATSKDLSMASASSPDSDVTSTTVQVTSIGGQQIFQSGKGQQYLIVNQSLQGNGGRIQIVSSEKQESGETVLVPSDAMRRREILARQPSYCKILNDLKEVESSESEEQELAGEATETKQEKPEVGEDLVMKGEAIDVLDGSPPTQTVVINGQAYQIVNQLNLVGGVSGSSVTTSSQQSASEQQLVTVQSNTNQAEKLARNREAARECR